MFFRKKEEEERRSIEHLYIIKKFDRLTAKGKGKEIKSRGQKSKRVKVKKVLARKTPTPPENRDYGLDYARGNSCGKPNGSR